LANPGSATDLDSFYIAHIKRFHKRRFIIESCDAIRDDLVPGWLFVTFNITGVFVPVEWQPEHTDRHLANINGVTPRLFQHRLPADVDRYQLAEYSDKFCKVSRLALILSLRFEL